MNPGSFFHRKVSMTAQICPSNGACLVKGIVHPKNEILNETNYSPSNPPRLSSFSQRKPSQFCNGRVFEAPESASIHHKNNPHDSRGLIKDLCSEEMGLCTNLYKQGYNRSLASGDL